MRRVLGVEVVASAELDLAALTAGRAGPNPCGVP